MNGFNRRYKHLGGLVAILLLVVGLMQLHLMSLPVGIFCMGFYQLSQFAMSKRCGACFNSVLTPEQVKEFERILDGVKGYDGMFKELAELAKVEGGFAAIKNLPKLLKDEQKRNDELQAKLAKMEKRGLMTQGHAGVRWVGGVPFVTDDCAKAITSVFVLECKRIPNALENLVRDNNARERILNFSAENLGIEVKAALDATSTPLPTVYVPQVIELVWKYGQARQYATVYPLGAGTVKLPRLKAGEDDFAYLGVGTAGMSQSVAEKKVTAELVTFTANKLGGLIRIPTELEEDTFIPLGQFLARYIARQLAKLEDKTLFLGDGTATYANQKGIIQYVQDNTDYLQQLAGGKTKPSDATINDFRAMRALISAQALVTDAAYYMHPTMEALMRTFNTIGQPQIYVQPTGQSSAMLDGYPIRWVGVMQPYTNKAAASTMLAAFGALSYWYLGERGAPRIEVSREVFFATDELAMRALERIDVEVLGIDAMSGLLTAAA